MIRTLWVYIVGLLATLWYSGGVVVRTYLWRRNLMCACDRAARNWAKAMIRAAGVKVVLEGTENLSKDSPQIIVANHQSWFDVFALGAELPVRYRFVAKKELEEIPVFGKAWTGCGHISVDRGNREAAIASMEEAFQNMREEGLTMILFPEGTRSMDGRLQKFKKGAFVLAVQGQVPLVPVAVVGSREVMPKGGKRVRPGTVTLRIGRPIPTEGTTLRDRNRLLKASRKAILQLKEEGDVREGEGDALPDSNPDVIRSNESP